MSPRRFFTALAVAAVGVVVGAVGVTYAVDRKAAKKHKAYRAAKAGAR